MTATATTTTAPVGITSREASARALDQVGIRGRKTQLDEVMDIVRGAQMHGAESLTRREIRQRWERLSSKRIDTSTVSARVNDLLAAGRLVASQEPRICNVTGKLVTTVFAPRKQGGLL